MKIRVELAEEFDVVEHAAAHARDEIPDSTPYGLHHLADEVAVEVSFRRPLRSPVAAWMARRVRNRLDGYEVVAAGAGALRRARRTADVVLCMDERAGFPAALLPGGPPVVSNLIWVGRPEDYDAVQRAAVRRALHRMAGVIVQSRSLADDITEGWELNADRVHLVRVGIDPAFFSPQPWTEDTRTVASVGDDKFRDHQLLIESVRRLQSRSSGQASPVRLELGTTMPGIEVPAELGVTHHRRMEGSVRAMYRRAGVIALALAPTTRGSGSTVVLEAAASARPVVATRTPAMADLVEHGVRGLLVAPEDPDAMADGIGELLADPGRAQRMGAAARQWLEKHRTSAHMAADIRRALERSLQA